MEIFVNNLNTVFSDFLTEKKKILDRNKITGQDINVFSFFQINETKHSEILAYFLDPKSSHGQRDLFLKKFLEKLNVEYSIKDTWTVTAEIGRIDVLLKRQNPPFVVIIENKSNFASDQEGQLFRYWYQEIFRPLILSGKVKNKEQDHARIIYLTPTDWKIPSEQSLTKPSYFNDAHCKVEKLEIGKEVQIQVFGSFIVEWLQSVIKEIPVTNTRLIELINQYIELWNN